MTDTLVEQTQDRIGKALGRIPSGCAILTARTATSRTGMLASWVQQAGFDPPTLSVAVKRGRPIEMLIDATGTLVLNLLGENPGPMFKHFGKGFAPEEDAFAGLDTQDIEGGVVIADQIAWLSAKVVGKHSAGDHWLYIAEVTNAEVDEAPDLKSPYVHLRKNGLSY
ncbi:MAG: flavin reductase family protein [Phycisphaerae bacterium]